MPQGPSVTAQKFFKYCTVFLLRTLIGTIPSPNDQRRPLPLLLCDSSSTVQVYSMLWIYRVNKILFSMPVLKSFCPKTSLNIPDKILHFQGIFIFTVYQTTYKWRESNLGCWVQTRVCGSGSDHLAGFRTKMIRSGTVFTGFNQGSKPGFKRCVKSDQCGGGGGKAS